MGISINLTNIKLSDESRMMNNMKVCERADVDLKADKIELSGKAVMLENLEMQPFLKQLQNEWSQMDIHSAEYKSIEQILKMSDKSKTRILPVIAKHIARFSEGILVNVISDYLVKR